PMPVWRREPSFDVGRIQAALPEATADRRPDLMVSADGVVLSPTVEWQLSDVTLSIPTGWPAGVLTVAATFPPRADWRGLARSGPVTTRLRNDQPPAGTPHISAVSPPAV